MPPPSSGPFLGRWRIRHRGLFAQLGQIATYRPLVGVVQGAVFGAVPAVAVVLKLVVMPGDSRPLDRGALVIIHVPFSHLVRWPLPLQCLAGLGGTRQARPATTRSTVRRQAGAAHMVPFARTVPQDVTCAAQEPVR